jgi:NitT/TauT family transport system substrate-binding protein
MVLALPCAIPVRAQPQTVIRLGIGKSDATAEGYYAQQLGFFKKAGLNVEVIQPFRTAETILTGVAAGSIDIGISSIPPLARAITRGAPLVLIAGAGLHSPHDATEALCVSERSSLRGPADFVGKTIAVAAIGNQSQLSALAWLDDGHVDGSRVHFIAVPTADMAAGIENGLADAAIIGEPWLSAAIRRGQCRIVVRPHEAIGRQFVIGVYFTTRKWYEEHPAVAKRFINAMYETARWSNAHHEQTAKLLSQLSAIDLQTVLTMKRTAFATSLDPALVQPPLDLAFKYHASDRALDASSLIAKSERP